MPCDAQKRGEEQAEDDSELLTMTNAVARGASNLTKREMDAFYYVMAYGRVAHIADVSSGGKIMVVKIQIKDYLKAMSEKNNLKGVKTKINKSDIVKDMRDILKDQGTITYRMDDGTIAIALCFLKVLVRKEEIEIWVDRDVAALFWGLTANFTQTQIDRIIQMRSRFAVPLYLNVMSRAGRPPHADQFVVSTMDAKAMFGLTKDDYMRKDKTFNRNGFEKKTIETAIAEINKLGEVELRYEKDKHMFQNEKGENVMRVTGYRFLWKPVAKMVPSEEKPMADVIADKRGEMAGPTGVKPTQEEIRKEFLGDDANDTDPNAYDNEEYFDK